MFLIRFPLLFSTSLRNSFGQTILQAIKNNNYKFSQWCLSAQLSGVSEIYFGFGNRSQSNAARDHDFFFFKQTEIKELAQQLALMQNNCWAIFETFYRQAKKVGDGETAIVAREPNRVFSFLLFFFLFFLSFFLF